MEIKYYEKFRLEEVKKLYESVGWMTYLEKVESLEDAYANSLCVFGAYDSKRLVGIIRAVGDGMSIVFVQDIIVLPEYQRKGIGTKLLKTIIDKYESVYQMELLTDDTVKTKSFYRSLGFTDSKAINCVAFIRMWSWILKVYQ